MIALPQILFVMRVKGVLHTEMGKADKGLFQCFSTASPQASIGNISLVSVQASRPTPPLTPPPPPPLTFVLCLQGTASWLALPATNKPCKQGRSLWKTNLARLPFPVLSPRTMTGKGVGSWLSPSPNGVCRRKDWSEGTAMHFSLASYWSSAFSSVLRPAPICSLSSGQLYAYSSDKNGR